MYFTSNTLNISASQGATISYLELKSSLVISIITYQRLLYVIYFSNKRYVKRC